MHATLLPTRTPAQRCAGFFMAALGPTALSMACALPTVAQVAGTDDYLARMDRNRDGRIALVEYQDWLSYAFDAMDRNHDGALSPGELPGGRGRLLTRGEHRERLAEAFARQDRDGDGFLDQRELAAPPR